MRILILKPSSLGDIIHALPTVNLIRRRYPQAHIAWLINTGFASLLKRCPIIDEIIPFDRHRYGSLCGLPAFADLLATLQGRQFDIVVDLQGLFRTGLIAYATLAKRRLGLSDSREGARLFHNEIVTVPRCHAVDRYLLAAKHLGCETGPVEFPLGLEGRASARPYIGINPSARWQTKLWGDDKFADLIRQLPRDRVVLTGSAAEANRLDKIAQDCRNFAGKTNLLELAELYRQCSVVITNDSGPMHLAAAVGTPVIAIFGPTDPALTGPYGDRHIVLRAGIPCSPCFQGHCSNRVEMECMQKVTVEQVLAVVKPFLV
ncbi:MAG: ADP-heptose--LPS heptosyltransferase 2 [Verrucomicrobiae bacterium]|nr:ADP-heptose--LPS heptosyltransferase 2 [Verrucomicrobiae bacterium]